MPVAGQAEQVDQVAQQILAVVDRLELAAARQRHQVRCRGLPGQGRIGQEAAQRSRGDAVLLQQPGRRDARLAHGRQRILGSDPNLVAGPGDGSPFVQHGEHLVAQRHARSILAQKVEIHVGCLAGAGLVFGSADQLVELEAALPGQSLQQAVCCILFVVEEGQQQVLRYEHLLAQAVHDRRRLVEGAGQLLRWNVRIQGSHR